MARNRRGWWQAAALAITVTLLLPLATFLVAVWLLGWQLQHVESGSMSPTYPVGSLLVTGDVAASDVEVGMPLVFEDPRQPGRLVTHRVVGLAPGAELAFVTRGDANATNDPAPVPARLVRGRVLWHVTVLGTVLDWLQWPRSFLLLVVLPAALLAALELRNRRIGLTHVRLERTEST
ncbi:MAG TPA: signal peptidase I [Candidatus Limnocylindrales bacterium]|jgi:signal peptidase